MGYWPAVMQAMKKAKVIIFVLDARMPDISRNRDIEKKLIGSKKEALIVFNKIDLISADKLKELKRENKGCFFVSSKDGKSISHLRLKLQILTKSLKLDRLEVGIVGYPNVGKSALTNILTRASKVKVSSKAGTTTSLQWASGTKIKILDSPGVIPFNDDEIKLGLLGAKDPGKLKNAEIVALKIIELFMKNTTKNLESLYGVGPLKDEDSYEIFMKIGEARKLLKKGGIIDEQRAAIMIIRDWQIGKLLLD